MEPQIYKLDEYTYLLELGDRREYVHITGHPSQGQAADVFAKGLRDLALQVDMASARLTLGKRSKTDDDSRNTD